MLIAYYSNTGNVERFVDKLRAKGLVCENISDHPLLDQDFILITPTQQFGMVPKEVEEFLLNNNKYLKAVASSGNKMWGAQLFGRSGNIISEQYNVPLLHKFQNHGFDSDIEIMLERVLDFG